MNRIAVFRALQLGDMLCAVPALRALRGAFTRSTITLIGLPWAQSFVARYPALIDELLPFPGAPGFPEQDESGAGLPALFTDACQRRFDLAIQMHGSGGIANDILFRLGAKRHAGFCEPSEQRDGCFLSWPDTLPEADRYLALIRRLGFDARDASLWFPLSDRDYAECEQVLAGADLANAIVVHPGAQLPSRRWPPARFAAVSDALVRAGRTVILTGTAAETAVLRETKAAMKERSIDLGGRTSLGALGALIAQARLVICNDTGVSHLAAALATPSVVVASGSDTNRWAPANHVLHRVLADYPPCRPCSHRTCPTGHECAMAVSVDAVIAAAREQLRGPRNAH